MDGLRGEEARNALRELRGIPEHADERLDQAFEQFIERADMAHHLVKGARADDLQARLVAQQRFSNGLIDYHLDRVVEEQLTDERVRLFYQENRERFAHRRYHVAHILLRSRGRAEGEDAGERSRAVLDALRDDASSFSEVAGRYSDDTATADDGGDLGWVAHEAMNRRLRAVVTELGVGDISDPVQTDRGWHVLKLLEEPEVKHRPFERVRNEVRYTLRERLRDNERERLRDAVQSDEQ